jgi:predicted Zn-dependent protease
MLTLYGRTLLQEGDLDDAEHALQQATLRFPVDPQAFVLYASIAERQRHFDRARQALIEYGTLTANEEDLAQRAGRIASLSLRLNDRATAVQWIARGLAREPNNAALLLLARRAR